jgi:TolA-binding protein
VPNPVGLSLGSGGFCWPFLDASQYLWDIIRLHTATSIAAALCGCAMDTASRAEVHELRSSLAALRQENGRLEARLDKLERAGALGGMAPSAPRPPLAGANAAGRGEAVPSLTVVKLKPKAQVPPPLNTRIEVVEPSEALLEERGESQARRPADEAPDAADLAAAEAIYQRGVDALKTGNIEGGLAQLRRFAAERSQHPRADNALYFSGLALMSLQDFEGAVVELEKVRSQYPAGDAMVDAMLKLGECRLRLHQPELAKESWEKIVASFPGTAAASQAQLRLASLAADPSMSVK